MPPDPKTYPAGRDLLQLQVLERIAAALERIATCWERYNPPLPTNTYPAGNDYHPVPPRQPWELPPDTGLPPPEDPNKIIY